MNSLITAFSRHPQSVGESYLEHARFAAKFSGTLFLAAFAALVHAVFPFAFEKTASEIVIRLHGKVANRGR